MVFSCYTIKETLHMEKDIINIIERHRKDVQLSNNQLTIKLKCTPISKKGKELFDVIIS